MYSIEIIKALNEADPLTGLGPSTTPALTYQTYSTRHVRALNRRRAFIRSAQYWGRITEKKAAALLRALL